MNPKPLFALLLVSAGAFASGLSYEQAKTRADRDEASLSAAQTGALIESQGAAAGDSFAKCPPTSSHPDLAPFTVVMELDASGKVVRTWLKGNSAIAVCFNAGMSHKSLFKPPRAPFYTSFEMSWRQTQ